MKEITLRFIKEIRREEKYRSSKDRRRKINHVLCEYHGSDGEEYRKSFESYGEPEIPMEGTNTEITKKRIQY